MYTYTKLKSGDWGIRQVGSTVLDSGAAVVVTTKAGAQKNERVGLKVWSGEDREGNHIVLYTMFGKEKAPEAQPASGDEDFQ